MRHLEHTSEPWNSLPSRKVTIIESGRAVLKSSMGRRWPVYVLLALVVVFSPILVFRVFIEAIEFDPALFVTEWLKLSIEGIIFFFILEIVRHRSLSFTAHQLLSTFMTVYYVSPIQDVTGSLTHFREALETHNSTKAIESITVARQKWNIIEYALSESALANLPNDAETVFWLLKKRNTLEPKRCGAILKSLSTVQHIGGLNLSEFEELLNRLEAFSISIRNLYRNLG